MTHIKILLVDDQNLIREGIKSLVQLRPDMHVVAEADDGTEVTSLIAKHQPDVLLLDLQMPGVNGQDVLRQMQDRNINTPVLILTTFDNHNLVLECIKLGAKGYLRKDVSFKALTNAILSLAQGKTWLQPAVTCRVEKGKEQIKTNDILVVEQLTEIEIQVLRLIAGGYSNQEIADALHKSVGTIRNQVSSILSKLDVRDRTRAVLKALEIGLI